MKLTTTLFIFVVGEDMKLIGKTFFSSITKLPTHDKR